MELLYERQVTWDKFCSGLFNSGAGITIWLCHPSLLLFMEPTEDCLCFVLRPSGCSSAQPWLIQAGLRGEQPGRVTPPGIWCLAAIKPAELCRSWGWNWQPLDSCSKNRTMQMIESSNVKAKTQHISGFILSCSFLILKEISSTCFQNVTSKACLYVGSIVISGCTW